MLAIKLQRIGKKHQPSFRVVIANKRSKLGGPPVEDVGSYNTATKKGHFKADRIKSWLGVGVKATPTVHNLLVREGVVKAPKRSVKMKKAAPKAVAPETPAAVPATETPAAE